MSNEVNETQSWLHKDGADDNQAKLDDKFQFVDEHIEYVSQDGKKVGYKGVYLLPNLLTTAAMFCGFYAILNAIGNQFEPAIIALFFAMLFDALDGRVARIMNAQSEFGKEYDSLSDLLSFGVAPAIIAYKFGLMGLGKIGWAISFLYLTCAALRLARFNTATDGTPSAFFSGLASPAAAGFLISFIWLLDDRGINFHVEEHTLLLTLLAVVTTLAGILMISNLLYYSFKNVNMKGRVSFVFLVLFVMLIVFVMMDPPLFLSALGLAYVVSGIAYTLYSRFFKTKTSTQETPIT
ncbi:MAG: CDP-diacylglycerol--serine O-phosphatidyltransferase [Pseudomonadota bacterium]